MKLDISSLLSTLDPVPQRGLTAAEQARQEQLLSTVLADTGTAAAVRTTRRSPVRRLAYIGAAVAGAAAVTAVAVPVIQGMQQSGPLSSAAVGSWTGTPVRLAAASAPDLPGQKWCEQHATGEPASGPFTITNADRRGTVTSMVLARGDSLTLCLVDATGKGLTSAIDPVGPIAADAIGLDTAGGHGEGVTGFNYVEGIAGTGVKAITLHEGDRTIEAIVDSGRWTAWWPTTNPNGVPTGSVTVTLADGTTRTVSGDSLIH
jgi:hypothetical protein